MQRGFSVCQYLPSELTATIDNTNVKVAQEFDPQTGENLRILPVNRKVPSRPDDLHVILKIEADSPTAFSLKLRQPWWLKSEVKCFVNDQAVEWDDDGNGFATLHRIWEQDEVRIILPHGLTTWPLPDRTGTVAFMDGPVVLAGLVSEERMLYGDLDDPSTMLIPDDEREWQTWKNGWRTVDQPVGWRFKPLYEIGNDVYTVYFPVKKSEAEPK